jgi:diacylglycerol kinase (ATP)
MVEDTPREVKDFLEPVAYVLGGVKLLFTQQLIMCSVEIDGKNKSELSVRAITVATVAPATLVLAQGFGEVIPDDGFLLDGAIATAENKLSELESMAFLLAASAVV